MNVNNKGSIRKVALHILNHKKSRRNILLISIVLTCVLFTTLFSVTLGIIKSMEFQTMKSIGSISHGSFKELNEKDIKILSKDKNIKDFSIRTRVGILDNDKVMAELSYQDEKGFKWAIINNVRGSLPKEKKEVFVEINTIRKLGYKGKIGEKIRIPFNIMESYSSTVIERLEDEFIISGTYENPIDSNVGVGQIYLSKEYVENLNLPNKSCDMEVVLNNSINIRGKLIDIANRNGYKVLDDSINLGDKEIRIGVNFAYFGNDENFDYKIFAPVLFLALLVFIAAYLIINNIFSISINEDIKIYGLLKTIGMTKTQTKKLIRYQGIFLCIPSIVVGNIIGLIMGRLILNKIFENNEMLANINISYNILFLIIVFSIIFTIFTILISVNKPAKIAAKFSPIDASKFNEYKNIKNIKSEEFSLNKLAFRKIFSKKFRFMSIVLSMSLSAVILNSVLSYTSNIDLKAGISDIIITDYNLASPRYFRYMYLSTEDKLNEKYIDLIKSKKGFKNGGAIYSTGSEFLYPNVKINDEKLIPFIFGIDNYLLSKMNVKEGSIDGFKEGNRVIIGEGETKSKFNVGDKINITFNNKTMEAEVIAKIDYNFANGIRYFYSIEDGEKISDNEFIYLNPNDYTNLTGDKSIMSYGFDVEENSKEEFNNLLQSLENNLDFSFDSRDRQINSFKNFKNLIEFVGYSLSIILFIISILNFINIIATEIIKEKNSLSILEAVGMTKKSIRKYLIKKNLIYSISSLIFSSVLMVLINEFVLKSLLSNMNWTSYNFVILPLVIVNLINILLGITFTSLFYERQNRESLVERIRDI
ncbi:ABC transporter permease [Peptoniphilus sp. MSJ-1]|uniref:ABC transporter permease n=1 Tax=Peptoniphilus ovalis TaxID=2841503 RepID=A0ABS6FIM5_9FIRM|nr:ABC transporter permease [Peptoniphilus ovalis]MBU5670032.1 ABC transporter permease [Peptoniphilus ovalis]